MILIKIKTGERREEGREYRKEGKGEDERREKKKNEMKGNRKHLEARKAMFYRMI